MRQKWVLGASLLLNVFLIAGGIGATWVLMSHREQMKKPVTPGATWASKAKELPEADRKRVDELLRAAAISGEKEIAEARNLRLQASVIAGKDPYDAPQIMALSEQARALESQARAKVENAIITGLTTESPKTREMITGHLLRASFRYRRYAMPEPPPKMGEGKADDTPPASGPPQSK